MSQNTLIGIIIGVIIIGGGAWWFTGQQTPASEVADNSTIPSENADTTPTPSPTPTPTPTPTDTGTQVGVDVSVNTAPTSATVTYNGNGFSPREVTIKKGGTVIWKNTSGGTMWVASAQHPSHTLYNGTSRQEHCPDTTKTAFDQCQGGGDYSFTFNKTGAWGYHDHINASLFGKVNVVE